jgi:hypothetical protein
MPSPVHTSLRGTILAGFIVIALMAGGIGGWAAPAPIASTVIAPGVLGVDATASRCSASMAARSHQWKYTTGTVVACPFAVASIMRCE